MNSKLYISFLSDSSVYKDVQKLWADAFIEIIGNRKSETWVSNKLPNGEEILDGNPIFSVYLPDSRKAVRLIQNSIDNSNQVFSAWTSSIYEEDGDIAELVFSFQLNNDTYRDILLLSKTYINGLSIKAKMASLNKFYETSFQIGQARKFVKSKSLREVSLKISELVKINSSNVITLDNLRDIYTDKLEIINIHNKLSDIDLQISDSSINKFIMSIQKSINNIVVVIASENFSPKNRTNAKIYEFKNNETHSIIVKLNREGEILEGEVQNLNKVLDERLKSNLRRKSIQ